MLVVETIGRIRREHRIKGKSIKEIARDLKVSRNTVRKVLRSGATSFEYMRVVQPRPKLGAWCQRAPKFPRKWAVKIPWFGGGVRGSVISRRIDRRLPLK